MTKTDFPADDNRHPRIVAIAFSEPEAEALEAKIVDAPRRFMTAAPSSSWQL